MFSLIIGAEDGYVAGWNRNAVDHSPICRSYVRACGDWEVVQKAQYCAIGRICLEYRQSSSRGPSKRSGVALTMEISKFVGAENKELILNDGAAQGAPQTVVIVGRLA